MRSTWLRLASALAVIAIAFGDRGLAFDRGVPVLSKIVPPPLPLGVISFPNGKAINLSVNIAAGSVHPRDAAPTLLWTVTARGPVIPCRSARAIIGLDEKTMCGGDIDADIAPLPSFAPSIYGLEVGADNIAHVTQLIAIRDRQGRPLSGLANDDPDDTVGTYDVTGKALIEEQNGIHPGGIARLADGSFWVGERYAPSLLHVAADGTLLERIVPEGTESDYASVQYPVRPGLPAILARLDANAELTCLTLTPDGQSLYLALKNPPPVEGEEVAPMPYVRMLRFDLASGRVSGQFAYALDEPKSFRVDSAAGPRRQGDVHMVEIIALSATRLLTVERIQRTTRFSITELEHASELADGDPGAVESMTREQFAASHLRAAEKTLIFDTDGFGEEPTARGFERIESVSRMSDRDLILITDNAFGIEGERVRMFRLSFPVPIFK